MLFFLQVLRAENLIVRAINRIEPSSVSTGVISSAPTPSLFWLNPRINQRRDFRRCCQKRRSFTSPDKNSAHGFDFTVFRLRGREGPCLSRWTCCGTSSKSFPKNSCLLSRRDFFLAVRFQRHKELASRLHTSKLYWQLWRRRRP